MCFMTLVARLPQLRDVEDPGNRTRTESTLCTSLVHNMHGAVSLPGRWAFDS